jgi:hypothetical protein
MTRVATANWSGYAQVGKKTKQFTAAMAEWYVPRVYTKKSGDQYAADWVGIDGAFNNDKLVQAGTTSENIGGEAKYYAWTEILPASAVRTSLAIHPGDLMTAEVREVATDKWKMTVVDGTTGKTFARAVSYTTPEQDVEAVHERPMISGSLSALAKTDNVEFLGVWASTFAPGRPPGWEYISGHFPGATRDRVFMVNHGGGAIIAAPSAITDNCFVVADGGKSPPPPTCEYAARPSP